ncbi:MAG: OmpA family protein [Ignavibacteriales bacterium]|nr:OmpA family protein [Ignavibacteriales bacterium]
MPVLRVSFLVVFFSIILTSTSLVAQDNLRSQLFGEADQVMNQAKEKKADIYAPKSFDAGEAEDIYRTAELEAIKANFLSPARALLARADALSVKDHAPKTLEKAERLATRAEELLKQNRYDTDEARQYAQEAKYEAAHAIYLHETIKKMKQADESFEDAMLSAESQFQIVAGALGFLSRFDSGYARPVANALAAIKERDAKVNKNSDALLQAAETIRQKETEIDNLKQQVTLMERRLGTLSEAERRLQDEGKELQRKIDVHHQQEQTVQQVAGMFTEDEGKVLRDGNNIVLRLYGLTFPVGKSTIEAEFYGLLTKVQEAIKKFPHCRITIEGHTDSQGSDDANQTLSESRAKAVAEYLMANMGVEIPVEHQGYGESRPVATNDTPEGRVKNRRIDLVITPEWSAAGR